MKENLLSYLACPNCGGELSLNSKELEDREVISGELRCPRCQSTFPIRSGVPRFADLDHDETQRDTAENFGAQWLSFDQVQGNHGKRFWVWIAPVRRVLVGAREVFEGGGGKGRQTGPVGCGARAT